MSLNTQYHESDLGFPEAACLTIISPSGTCASVFRGVKNKICRSLFGHQKGAYFYRSTHASMFCKREQAKATSARVSCSPGTCIVFGKALVKCTAIGALASLITSCWNLCLNHYFAGSFQIQTGMFFFCFCTTSRKRFHFICTSARFW